MAVVGLSGCGGSDGDTGGTTPTVAPDVQAALCPIYQRIGDLNCDGRIEEDSDHDGIVDLIDRYRYGYDFGDDDGDGIANWADTVPQSARSTVVQPIQELAAKRALEEKAAQMAEDNAATRIILDSMERETERRYSQDADSDGTPDIYDAEPRLHSLGDADNDGTYNDRDHFPLNDSYR
jgi:hypothetical protein